jgi:uncharacterized protein (DUF433 family)
MPDWQDRIAIDPKILVGMPVIKRTVLGSEIRRIPPQITLERYNVRTFNFLPT